MSFPSIGYYGEQTVANSLDFFCNTFSYQRMENTLKGNFCGWNFKGSKFVGQFEILSFMKKDKLLYKASQVKNDVKMSLEPL